MKRFMRLVACLVVIAFSNMLALTSVAQVAPKKVEAPPPAKVEAPPPVKVVKAEPFRTDDIVVPLRMPSAVTVEKGGTAVLAPVSVNVTVPEALPSIVVMVPPAKTPFYETWWFWTIVTGVAAGAVIGGVCGSGHCGTTTNVHFGR